MKIVPPILLVSVKRYQVTNSNDPTQGNITKKKRKLKKFINYVNIVMDTLGQMVFELLPGGKEQPEKIEATPSIDALILHLKQKNREGGQAIVAKYNWTNGVFIILIVTHCFYEYSFYGKNRLR